MPLQNRVTPFGDIVAVAARGTLTGNRGIIHDPATKTLLTRRWSSYAWITCTCEFRGRRRKVMATRSWTELFFLDEASAFAAGHRPCFYCRRADALAFRAAWARGNGCAEPRAPQMDRILHRERLDERHRKRLHPLPAPLADLPDGAMVAADGESFLLLSGKPLMWAMDGYRMAAAQPTSFELLTPPSTLRAFAAGYRPALHPSATAVTSGGMQPPHSPKV